MTRLIYPSILCVVLLACSGNIGSAGAGKTCVLTVDGAVHSIKWDDIATSYEAAQGTFSFAILSEKENLQFAMTAYMQTLTTGSYQVFTCRGPSECDQAESVKNQGVLLAPYPSDIPLAENTTKRAYNGGGYQPLQLTISAITDEQQPGVPWKTKRVTGTMSGNLVYMYQSSYEWHAMGQPIKLEGKFDVFCKLL